MKKWAVLLIALEWVTPSVVRAQDKQACYKSHEQAQLKKREGNPRAARDVARVCAQGTCPQFIQDDCVVWAEEAERAIPTVVLQAMTDEGDASEAVVTLDGAPMAIRLDGKSLEVDPGSHVIRFVLKGQEREMRMVVKEGEKRRTVVADFRTPKAQAASPVVAAPRHRPISAMTWGSAAVGVAGFLGFGTLAILGTNKYASLRTSCAPFCTDAQTASARSLFVAADVSLAVAIVGTLGAFGFYLTRPEVPEQKATLRIVPDWSAGAQSVHLVGTF